MRDFLPPTPLSRRALLGRTAYGIGGIALASLLQREGLLANPALAGGVPQHYDLTPKPAHGFGQAKAMISMFMQGGPSHIDLFEPKPELMKLDGKNFPGEIKVTVLRETRAIEVAR